ncbi:hypothetical protein [Paenibacillus jilunlii]|uniref:Uncharacterized protein n=1 Tax=Paenibacillus jilunlii TaxID=682956 RepID=A0A1G9JYG2_9BACL|nr:hypothetical protein [Paenibacillus jilunlii]KWX70115.1 hypothetical protein AML91_30785 [Paenibacillus jilunlii]SDL42266.1 hypothetical protein SAMN05216191_10333 [Paenibacillus jilunlii]
MIREPFQVEFRFAKSYLEHEEGINHLWIRLPPLIGMKRAAVGMQLPVGIYWTEDAGAYPMDADGQIRLEPSNSPSELLLEIYTLQPISPGLTELIFTVSCIEGSGEEWAHSFAVPLMIVDEEEAEPPVMDHEIVRKVKGRQWHNSQHPVDQGNREPLDCTPRKQIRYDPHYRSELEKQYSIEG